MSPCNTPVLPVKKLHEGTPEGTQNFKVLEKEPKNKQKSRLTEARALALPNREKEFELYASV